MDYYKQGDPANADKIKAAFEKLGYKTIEYCFNAERTLYFTFGGAIKTATYEPYKSIIKTHPDYKELELRGMTMTREDQIIEAGKIAAEGKEFSVLVNRQHRTMSAYEIGFIEGAQWADQFPNWISVEDELPKERGQYFVYTAAGQSWQSEWMQDKSGEWCWFCSPMTVGTIANVTHWMPIVPPRKEEK